MVQETSGNKVCYGCLYKNMYLHQLLEFLNLLAILELSFLSKQFLIKKITCKKEILLHLYTSLHTFLNLHGSQFCPKGEPFYI